jgi:hypothetical protein
MIQENIHENVTAQQASAAACESASEAQAAAQEARESAEIARENSPTSVDEVITWTIDRTPDYSIYLNLIENTNIINYNNYYNNYNIGNYYNDNSPTIPFSREHNITIVCKSLEISDEELDCCICMEQREKEEICSLNCNHKFCGLCIEGCLKKHEQYTCSLCREPVTEIETQKIEIKEKLGKHCL